MEFIKGKGGRAVTVVSGVLTAVISLVMNLLLIPKIESATEGVRCFDMNFGYGYEEAQSFLTLLSDEGRQVYLYRQLPLDFIYPVVYTVFFVFLIARLSRRFLPLCVLPLLLTVADYTENVCIILMLKSAALSAGLANFAGAVTAVKTLLMYAVFAVILVCIAYRLIQRRKR